jgi:Cytidylate kinase-like family
VVTLAALYGASGSIIGPRVAEELGVPLLDRQIPGFVSRRTGLSAQSVSAVDEEPRSRIDRLVSSLSRASTPTGGTTGSAERLDFEERRLRAYIEEFLARSSRSGGVAIGRGGMVVLRSVPWALHVHLGGPLEARIEQRMALDGIDRETARRRQKTEDGTRMSYVRKVYGVDGADPALYHLMLDSTALDVDTCVELIVSASRSRTRHPKPTDAT